MTLPTSPVQVMSVDQNDPANRVPFGPMFSIRMTADSGLRELGCGFIEFAESGSTDPWTLRYEEVLHVLRGTLILEVLDGDDRTTVTVQEGEVVTLADGSTVTYGGDAGTRFYWSLVPQDWHERPA